MKTLSDLPTTYIGKREKECDNICKHKILPKPKVLKIWKIFVLLWLQLKDMDVQMEVCSFKRDHFVGKKKRF